MHRNHRGRRNILIDLTSLLDVVFLILFIVIQNSQLSVNASNEELETTKSQLEETQTQLDDARNEAKTWRNELTTYQNFGRYAAVITITLDYNEQTPSMRYIDGGGGGFEMDRIDVTPDNENTAWERFRGKLDTFIREKEEEGTPVVITYNREGGSHRDYGSLQSVLNALQDAYDNLYIK